jgi:NMT1/THI5 like protein
MRIVQTQILSRLMLAAFLSAALLPRVLDAQTQKIRIAYSSRSNTITPLYVAASKGFFREEGLEVELIQVSPRLGAMAVMNGDVSFTTSFVSTFRGILQGLPLKVILIALKKGMYFLVVRPEIRDIQDLKGKKLGVATVRGTDQLVAGELLRSKGFKSPSARIRSGSGGVGFAALRRHAAADGLQSIGRPAGGGNARIGFVHRGSFAEGKSSNGETDFARFDQSQPVHRRQSPGDDRRDVKVAAANSGSRRPILRSRAQSHHPGWTNDRR